MADSATLPGFRSWPNMPPEWWRFFRDLSSTTTTATVDLSGYLPITTNLAGSPTIQVTGTLASGSARFDLRTLANTAGGSFLLVTRDTYGRISASSAGDAADVPVDDTAWTEISGADVQAAFDSTDAELALKAPLANPPFTGAVGLPSYTVATLPSATPAGRLIYVTDESGGAVPAFSDATNWRRVTDRAIVT